MDSLQPFRVRFHHWLRTRYVPVLVLVAVGAGVTGSQVYHYLRGHAAPKYRLARIERGSLTAAVVTNGTVSAMVSVQVGSQVSGRVKDIFVDFNSIVKKDQFIARLDAESFEARVVQARAQFEAAQAMELNQRALIERTRAEIANARATLMATTAQIADAQAQRSETKRQLDRRIELLRKELIAPSEMDSAKAAFDSAGAKLDAAHAQALAQEESIRAVEAQLKVAQAQLQAARAQVAEKRAVLRQAQVDLQNTRILAPVDGIVVARHVDVGETVAATLQSPLLFTIAQDLTKMQVNANVDEADIGQIHVGQHATFTVDAFRTQTFAGEVTQIRKAAQVVQSVVTYVTVISAPNPELKLLPGMTASVRIIVDRKEHALKVPNAALRFRPPDTIPDEAPGSARASETQHGSHTDKAGAGSGTLGGVWVLDATGRLEAVEVQVGSSDGTFSEVLGGALTEGQEVVVSATEPPSSNPARGEKRPRAMQRI